VSKCCCIAFSLKTRRRRRRLQILEQQDGILKKLLFLLALPIWRSVQRVLLFRLLRVVEEDHELGHHPLNLYLGPREQDFVLLGFEILVWVREGTFGS
jgi:hypothetical protein